jgi:hypothetical protein
VFARNVTRACAGVLRGDGHTHCVAHRQQGARALCVCAASCSVFARHQIRDGLTERLMLPPNESVRVVCVVHACVLSVSQQWSAIMAAAAVDVNSLIEPNTVRLRACMLPSSCAPDRDSVVNSEIESPSLRMLCASVCACLFMPVCTRARSWRSAPHLHDSWAACSLTCSTCTNFTRR